MHTIIVVLHIIVAVFLILVVLLQTGKGAAMGSAFGGGGSQTLFGSSGAGNFLSKLTTGAAIVFMLTSLGLTVVSNKRAASSLIQKETPSPAAPAPAAPQTPSPAATSPVATIPTAPLTLPESAGKK